MQIDGRVVVITGASEGIGAACASAFAQRGARLALVARTEETLRKVAAGLGGTTAGADALVIPADLREPPARRQVIERALSHFGQIDILINNAGIGLYAPAWQAPMAEVRKMFELNLFAAIEMIQLVTPHMRKGRNGVSNGKPDRAIVNVGSIAGKVTLPWFTLYSASKYALGSLSDGLRMELKADEIHVMTVCPGYVKTNFQGHVLAGTPPPSLASAKRFGITPVACAAAIVKGVERNARTVVTPRYGWVLVALERIMPSIIDGQLERVYRKHARVGTP